MSERRKGQPKTPEWRERLSNSLRSSAANCAQLRARYLAHPTALETIVGEALQQMNVAFEAQWAIVDENGYMLVDFYITARNLVIECDGTGWHTGHHATRHQDRDTRLQRLGYTVIHLTSKVIHGDVASAIHHALGVV